MKVIKKKNKKPLIIAILAGILVLLIAAILIINALTQNNADSGDDEKEPPVVDEDIGESVYAGSGVVYPRVVRTDMTFISISGGKNNFEYGFMWDDGYGTHILYKENEQGEVEMYNPAILMEYWADAEYSDFYAVETSDGYNMPKLFYLCSGIGTAYFSDKLEILAETDEEREAELSVYGLSKEDNPVVVKFSYDADGDDETEEERHVLTIGNQLIYGQGYYFMVDGRDYVYTTNSNQFQYTLLSYIDYINPLLVSSGLSVDNAFEPYLTTDYKQWKNEIYDNDGDLDDDGVMESEPDKVKDGSIVNITGDKFVPYTGETTQKYPGYLSDEDGSFAFNLEELAKTESGQKLATLLKSSCVGALKQSIPMTLVNYSNAIVFADKDDVKKYTYNITLVEAIITDGADIVENGTQIGENNIIKVIYTYSVAGEETDGSVKHAVIDLSSNLIPDAAKDALRAAKIGEQLSEPVEFEIAYDMSNAKAIEGSMVITGIIGVKKTESNEIIDTVEDGCTVMFNYYLVRNGVAEDKIYTTTIEINDDLNEDDRKVADVLMGRATTTECEIPVDFVTYCEIFASFTYYNIKSIDSFVVREMIVSFEFVQVSERDPYYGESFYTNTLENKNSLYALNASSCEAVVEVLGGLLESATSSTGLQGSKVVDLNITPAKLQKYGLYANMIYFELPRNITGISGSTTSSQNYLADLEDYTYFGTLGFTLYISDEVTENGKTKRYIASDLYDVIAEIDEEDLKNFVFLDQTFIDFYARKNLVLTNISNVSNVKMEFNLSDFSGIFNSEIYHNWVYAYNGKYYNENQLTEEQLDSATYVDLLDIYQTIKQEGTETELSKLLAEKGISGIALREFYDKALIEDGSDYLGTEYFKTFVEMLFYTMYSGSLDAEEQADNAYLIEEGKYLLSMTVSLGEVEDYKYNYVYEFYRISDRRVMVRLYKTDAKTGDMVDEAVNDFYISTFAFKKLANGYISLLNKEEIDINAAYS